MERFAWETPIVNGRDDSTQSQGYHSPDQRATGMALHSLFGDRPFHDQGSWDSPLSIEEMVPPEVKNTVLLTRKQLE